MKKKNCDVLHKLVVSWSQSYPVNCRKSLKLLRDLFITAETCVNWRSQSRTKKGSIWVMHSFSSSKNFMAVDILTQWFSTGVRFQQNFKKYRKGVASNSSATLNWGNNIKRTYLTYGDTIPPHSNVRKCPDY